MTAENRGSRLMRQATAGAAAQSGPGRLDAGGTDAPGRSRIGFREALARRLDASPGWAELRLSWRAFRQKLRALNRTGLPCADGAGVGRSQMACSVKRELHARYHGVSGCC